MRREDIILGAKVYIAALIEPVVLGAGMKVLVTEYTVTQAGKVRFEISGKRGRKSGNYANMGHTIESMQFSPAAAVDWLEKRRKKDVESARIALERAERYLVEDLKVIQEWRNERGL